MQRVRFSVRSLPLALALTTIAAYGLLLPFTGFYWDDWPFAWIARFQGPAEFFPAFQGFRPFLAPFFFFTTSLLPPNPPLWQAAALLMHCLAALAAWWSLDQAWPQFRGLTIPATLLFLVFPGYSQHWVALTHINQEWISLTAYLLSIGLSLHACRHPATAMRATLGALALQLLGLLPTEYFATLEPMRALLLWSALSASIPRQRASVRLVLRAWWPYLLVWILNGLWLAYFYKSGAYISYDLTAAATAPTLLNVLATFGDALWKAGAYVWIQVIPLTAAGISSPTSLATWIVTLAAFTALALYLTRVETSSNAVASRARNPMDDEVAGKRLGTPTAWHAIGIGALGILLGRIPSFLAGLPLTLQSSFDRLTISMALGAALLVAGVLQILIYSTRTRMIMLAALVALGVGQQFFNANTFRRDWQRQQEIYWQLAWRMPGIEPNTAILAQQMPLDYETDLAMTAALNWMYAPEVKPPHLPLAMVYTEKRLGGVVLPALEKGLPMKLPLRTMTFIGNTSDVIVIHVPADGCLRVFDPELDDAWTYSRLPEAVTAAIPLSQPDRILADARAPTLPSPPFSAEPEHGWCFFYEKAELARQQGNWAEIIGLRETASAAMLGPEDPFEWLPFIEAEARIGTLNWAVQQSLDLAASEPKLQRGLCALWSRVALTDAREPAAAGAEMRRGLACE